MKYTKRFEAIDAIYIEMGVLAPEEVRRAFKVIKPKRKWRDILTSGFARMLDNWRARSRVHTNPEA